MSARLKTLTAAVAERELDALLVSNIVNVRWLTGFTGSNALAVVGRMAPRFVTDFRYLMQAADQLDEAWEREIATELPRRAIEGLPADRPLRIGFDDAHVTVKQHAQLVERAPEGVELVAAGGMLEALRAVKDAAEIEAIHAAAKLADEALEEILAGGIVGRTERDVALDLEIAMRRRGAEGVSFAPIVASGPHGALPHAAPRDVAIPEGTLVVVDWGAVLDGYASDCTRTFATG
ncbi:MAG: Xaa-Pro aminopeptidase, partial [bacterium]